MTQGKTFLTFLLLIGLVVGLSSLYTIREGQQGLVFRLGKIKRTDAGVAKQLPGLHFKLPFIENVRKFDTRLQTMDIQSSRIVTSEKKDVIVDYYVKWRIHDLPLFYTRTAGDYIRAERLLEQQLNSSLRAQFGLRKISEVVANDRTTIMDTLEKTANVSAKPLGIDVVDVRIKRIDLPDEVSNAVFERMRAERQRVARQHRSAGKAESEAIRASADAKVTVILATAKADAASIRAAGDGKAAKIYAKAYGKSPSFYAFYRSINAYRDTFNNRHDVLVLSPNSQFFRYFNQTIKKQQ